MKNLFIFAIAALSLIGLTGCGSSDSGEPAPKVDAAKDAAIEKDGSAATPTQD